MSIHVYTVVSDFIYLYTCIHSSQWSKTRDESVIIVIDTYTAN